LILNVNNYQQSKLKNKNNFANTKAKHNFTKLMRDHFIHIGLLFKRLFLIYIAFIISRLLFLSFNYSYFADNSIIDFAKIFSIGSLFDGVPIIVFNTIFIILHLLPFNFRSNKTYQKLIFVLFILVNSLLLLANFIDIEYFKFTNKRTTFDVFSLIFTGDDIGVLIPQFLKDFWFIIFLWILLIAIMIFFYPKRKDFENLKFHLLNTILQGIISIILITSFVFMTRGFGLRPVSISSAAKYTKSDNIPLLLNTPFTILKTIGKRDLQKKEYFTKEELKSLFNPIKEYKSDTSFNKMNVVIIILESFGKDYTGFYNNQAYTPFLDSLIAQSLSFKYSFANGKKSMEAVPAIVTSLPALSDNPYILSQYSTDDTYGLAEILKDQGYYTAFFHGGINGTMGFDNFALANGFD
jgi:phosphoglycerol transferase MdoB-like AlkP superfamily enzyme